MKNLTIGLVAHDAKKAELVEWVGEYREFFQRHTLFATGTTGKQMLDAYPEFNLTRMKSGPLGGDQQLGAMISEKALDLLFFFTDPLTPMPHDVDVKALIRLSTLYDIPVACNRRTAHLILHGLFYEEREG